MSRVPPDIHCRVELRPDDAILRDHRVHGVRILPGVTFLDMTWRLLAAHQAPADSVELRRLVFRRAPAVDDTRGRELSLTVEPATPDLLDTARDDVHDLPRVIGRGRPEGAAPDTAWDEHFTCELHRVPSTARLPGPITADTGGETHDLAALYTASRALGTVHGPFMTGLGSVHVRPDGLLADIHLGDEARDHLEDFFLHPTFLDCATLVPSIYFAEAVRAPQQPVIPIYIESFRAVAPLRSPHCRVWVPRAAAAVVSPELAHADIHLLDDAGRTVASFHRISFKRIRTAALITALTTPTPPPPTATPRLELPTQHAPPSPAAAPLREPLSESLATEHAPPSPAATSRPPHADLDATRHVLRQLVAGLLDQPAHTIATDVGFYDLGLASTDLLDIVQRLETRLGRQLYPTLLFEYQTIDALARWLAANHPTFITPAAPVAPTTPADLTALPTTAPATPIAAPAAPAPTPTPTAETLYARPTWHPEPLAPASPLSGPLLLLDPPPGAPRPPAAILVTPGDRTTWLTPSHVQVRPDHPEDLHAALARLVAEGRAPAGVIHVDTTSSPIALYARLLALVRALWTALPDVRLPILHIETSPGRPEAHAVRAFAATLARELPRLPLAVLEVDAWPDHATLSAELATLTPAAHVRRIAGARTVRRWRAWHPDTQPTPDLRGRCIILTGGAGGLGRLFARHLARAGAAILLTARRPEDADIRALLAELHALGGRAAYLAADVRDPADVARTIAEARRRFGPVHGILHAAGQIADALLADQDPARAQAVLAAKIDGLRHLEAAAAAEPLEFLIVCSSLAGVLGNVGQADYAFANGWTDGLAAAHAEQRARGLRTARTTAIAWPLWHSGGMRIDARTADRLARLGTRPLATDTGLRALDLALAGPDAGPWTLLTGDPAALRTLLALDPAAPEDMPIETGPERHPAATRGPEDMRVKTGPERQPAHPPLAADTPIAILGVAGRYPHAADLEQLWDDLRAGHDAITDIPADRWDHARWYDPTRTRKDRAYTRWGGFLTDVDRFDPLFFGIVPREAEIMDPQERLFLETAWHTLEDAGYPRRRLAGERVGVFVGVMYGHYQLLGLENTLRGRGPTPGTFFASVANRVSYFFDLRGPSLAVDTMCSSSLTALHLACDALRRGDCRYALVGGVNLMLHPTKYVFLSQARMAASDGRCRGFGAGGDGYVPGEGVGAVLLKPLAAAEADGDRILAVIRGSAVGHGGRTGGYSVPSPQAQADVVLEALQRAGVDPRTIGCVEAHGTGTALGDPIEIEALTRVFRRWTDDRGFCAIGTIKSNLGHLESAAGIAGLTRVLLQLRHRTLVPTLHADTLNPAIDFDRSPFVVQRTLAPFPAPTDPAGRPLPRRAALSSFGAGGANVHVILEEHVATNSAIAGPDRRVAAQGPELYVFSAARPDRLRILVARHHEFLARHPELAPADVAWTLQVGRDPLARRLAVVAADLPALIAALALWLTGEPAPGVHEGQVSEAVALPDDDEDVAALLRRWAARGRLDRVAAQWVAGASIDFRSLRADRPRHLSLPGYPFARDRVWLPELPGEPMLSDAAPNLSTIDPHAAVHRREEPVVPVEDAAGVGAHLPAPDPLAGLLFTPGHRPAPLPAATTTSPAHRRVVVLATPDAPPDAWLAPLLAGASVLRVDTSRTADEWRILLGDDPPDAIYHLAGLVPDDADPDDLDLLAAVEQRALVDLLHLLHALFAAGLRARPLALFALTNRTRAVDPGERLAPHAAGLFGFCRTLAAEVPAWKVSCIDIALAPLADDRSRVALTDLLRACAETPRIDLVLRGRDLHEPTLHALTLPPGPAPVPRGATWLIVGGAGGLGHTLSLHLATATAATLIWIGRRPPGDELRRKQQAIVAAGGRVEYVAVDIADEPATRAALAPVLARLGPLHGVVHSALVLDDVPLERMDADRLRRVLAPKTRGSLVLARLLRDHPPAVVLVFGSAVSFADSPGQANYAAASTFQDAHADSLAARTDAAVRVLHWGFWGDVGAVATEAHHHRLARRGVAPLTAAEGLAAIERVLLHPVRRVLVHRADARVLAAAGVPSDHTLRPALRRPPLAPRVLATTPPPPLDPDRLADLRHGGRALTRLAVDLLVHHLRRHGLPAPGADTTVSALRDALAVTPFYERLFTACLDILDRHARITRTGDRITARTAPAPIIDPDLAVADFSRASPGLAAHARLLARCLAALPDVASGRRGYADVLFPGGSSADVRAVYDGNLLSDYHNALVADLVAAAVRERLRDAPGAPLWILEVGAGTGGTTRPVLAALRPFAASVEYHFTDVAPAFLEQARRDLADHPHVRFHLLDLEQPPTPARPYDLAFASNVVHATRRIDRALLHLRMALAPGGLLILNEATGPQEFANLTFGLTTGWWLYEDPWLRQPGAPLLDADGWRHACLRAGFADPQILGVPQLAPDAREQLVVVAESGPLIPVPVPADTTTTVTAESTSTPAAAARANHRSADATRPAPPTPAPSIPSVEPLAPASTPDAPDEPLAPRVRAHVRTIFAELLHLRDDDLDDHANFEAFGVDSVMVVDLTDRLKRDLGDLPATLLFEHNTLDRLCRHLLAKHEPALASLLRPPPKPAPRDEPDARTLVTPPQPTRDEPIAHASPTAPQPTRGEPDEPIAIIGMSGRYPGARDLVTLWQALRDGRSAISELPDDRLDWRPHHAPEPGEPGKIYTRWAGLVDGVAEFDPLFFKLSPREAEAMDPQERLFLQTAYAVLEDAGHTRRSIGGDDRAVGVFVGVMHGTWARVGGALRDRGVWHAANAPYWSIANRVSYQFDFQGPSYAVDSACSSSLTAIHLACESLRRGECRAAIAGGVNLILHADHLRFLASAGMLSRGPACRAFGADADGFVDGEGVGAVLLKPLRAAAADGDRILGVILSTAVNAGGKTSGYTVPNPGAHTAVVRSALRRAGVDPATIGYVEAHGTGTALGDPIEIAGLTAAWREHTDAAACTAIGSIKSNLGHLEAAAGIAGLTRVLLQLQHRELAPTLHADPPNPRLDLKNSPFHLQLRRTPWTPARPGLPLRAAISSFGAGGANVHMLVEGRDPPPARREPSAPRLIVLSARDEQRLRERVTALLDHLPGPPQRPDLTALRDLAADILGLARADLDGHEPLGDLGFDRVTLHRLREAWRERWPDPPDLSLDTTLAALTQPATAVPAPSDPADLTDLAYTLQVGREAMEARLAFVARDLPELRRRLAAHLAGAAADRHHGLLPRLVADPQRDDLAARALVDGDLEALAALWVQGARIDWPALYRERPRRVSLPTYPFAREHCWVPALPPAPAPSLLTGPLLSGASAGALVFRRDIEREHSVAREHRVQDRPLLPGVATLALLAEAVARVPDLPRPYVVEDLTWTRPVTLDAAVTTLQLSLRPDATFVLERVDGDATTALAQGRIAPCTAADPPPLALAEIAARCPEVIDGPAGYDRFEAAGIAYGPRFRRIRSVRRSPDEALASLHPAHTDELDRWAALDVALQTVAFLTDAQSGPPPLPFALGRHRVLADLGAARHAHARRRAPDRLDVSLADAEGRVLAQFENVVVRAARDPFPPICYAPRFRRAAALPDEPLPANPALIVTPEARERCVPQIIKDLPAGTPVIPLDDTGALRDLACDHLAIFAVPRDLPLTEDATLALTLPVFRVLKSLIDSGWTLRPHRLTLVTRRVQAVADDDLVDPTAAALPGLLLSLAREYPTLRVCCLDVDDLDDLTAAQVFTEPGATWNGLAALRRGRRHLPHLEPLPLPPARDLPLRPRGVYLIVGGAGGIGLELAVQLARTHAARLVIVGRRPLDERRVADLARIDAAGGESLYVQADVADPHAADLVVRTALARHGAIHGVFHAAIVMQDAALATMDEARFLAALRPKLGGSLHVFAALRGRPLDFALFFSSAQALAGSAGQANYAAACTFKDAFARWLRAHGVARSTTIDWGAWGEVGIVRDPAYQERLARRGIRPIAVHEGLEAIRRILAVMPPAVVAIKADPVVLTHLGLDPTSAPPERAAPSPTSPLADPPTSASRTTASAPAITSASQTTASSAPALADPPPLPADERARLDAAFRSFTALAVRALLVVLQDAGLFRRPGDTADAAAIQAALQTAPAHARLQAALLAMLVRHGHLEPRGPAWCATPRVTEPAAPLADACAALLATHPGLAPHVRLLAACLARYPDLLAGRLPATDALFPAGSLQLVEGIYRGNPIADHFQQLLAARVATLTADLLTTPNRVAHILEVGAGTGGTTGFVLPALAALAPRVAYAYSDTSRAFLDHGRARFAGPYPFTRFQLLDLERDPPAQGWEPGRHDVIVAANVVHATRRLDRTLDHLATLLAPGGWLVLNEATAVSDFLTMTFGLLDGWWRTEDPEIRLPHAPLLDAASWIALLRASGFTDVHALGLADADVGQHLILARRPPQPTDAPATDAHAAAKPRATTTGVPPADAPVTAEPRPAASPDALRRRVEQSVLASLQSAMGLAPGVIDPTAPFSDYGVDSITGVTLINALARELGLVLRTSLLFDCPGVRALTDWIVLHHAAQLAPPPAAPAPDPQLDALERLARGELDIAQTLDLLK